MQRPSEVFRNMRHKNELYQGAWHIRTNVLPPLSQNLRKNFLLQQPSFQARDNAWEIGRIT